MKVLGGSIIDQREDSLGFVKEHIKLHAKVKGTERIEKWEYPIEALTHFKHLLKKCYCLPTTYGHTEGVWHYILSPPGRGESEDIFQITGGDLRPTACLKILRKNSGELSL